MIQKNIGRTLKGGSVHQKKKRMYRKLGLQSIFYTKIQSVAPQSKHNLTIIHKVNQNKVFLNLLKGIFNRLILICVKCYAIMKSDESVQHFGE